jgi:hypothetical protein
MKLYQNWVPHPRRVFVFAPRVGYRNTQSPRTNSSGQRPSVDSVSRITGNRSIEVIMQGSLENKSRTSFEVHSSDREIDRRGEFLKLFRSSPIPPAELLYSQLSLYLPRQELSRMLALSDLYRNHLLNVNGVLMEFGTCYGRTASLRNVSTSLRQVASEFSVDFPLWR